MRFLLRLLMLAMGLGVCIALNAMDNRHALRENTHLGRDAASQNAGMPSSTHRDSDDMAHAWGLTKQEWRDYLRIKQGPRGYWSPDLDPLTTLGIHANTEAKRRKYARLLAQLEKTRIEQELAFQRVFREEFRTLYPALDVVDRDRIRQRLVERHQRGPTFQAGDRALAFVGLECPQCLSLSGLLIERTKTLPHFAVDFYIVGTGVSDTAIRQWATQVGIPKKLVDQGRITLNSDQGTLAQLTHQPFPTVPQVIRDRRHGESHTYEVIPLEQLTAY